MSKREKKLNGFTREYLASLFDYNPDTGELKWKVSRNSRAKAGDGAGYVSAKGYRIVCIGRKALMAGRLAYFLVTGEVPERVKAMVSLRFVELVPCSRVEETALTPLRRDNTSGYRGVTFSKRKRLYKAELTSDRHRRHLGYFDTPEEAARAYNKAAREHFGEFAQLNPVEGVPTARVLCRRNTSGYRGVYRDKSGNWHAAIKLNRKQTYLGVFDTPEEAARAYNKAAKQLHGKKAKLNILPEDRDD